MSLAREETSPNELRNELQSGINLIGLNANPRQLDTLLDYLDLLEKWNSSYNLSGIKDKSKMVIRHLLDSLSISPYIYGKAILDIGSGAGLPGIPLAIMHPQTQFLLLDSNGKKTRFLSHVKSTLGLANISIENKRIEDYQCPVQIDIVMSRAFASLPNMLQLVAGVIGEKTRIFAMKGSIPTEEIEGLSGEYRVARIITLSVPGLEEERHLIEIEQKRLPASN